MYAKASQPAGSKRNDPERERLIVEHLPQVKLIASRIRDKLPDSVALDDLISAGVLGLISAVDHFDADHKVKLKTYAEHKIRGSRNSRQPPLARLGAPQQAKEIEDDRGGNLNGREEASPFTD